MLLCRRERDEKVIALNEARSAEETSIQVPAPGSRGFSRRLPMRHGTNTLAKKDTIKLMPSRYMKDRPGQLNVAARITTESHPSQLDSSTVNRREVHIRGKVIG